MLLCVFKCIYNKRVNHIKRFSDNQKHNTVRGIRIVKKVILFRVESKDIQLEEVSTYHLIIDDHTGKTALGSFHDKDLAEWFRNSLVKNQNRSIVRRKRAKLNRLNFPLGRVNNEEGC